MQDPNLNLNDNSHNTKESKSSVPSDYLELDLEKIREFMYIN